jgi:ATP-dependent DNA helicase RecG
MPASPISLEMILAAAQAGEGVDWEFKSAKGGVPGSLWESYSANRRRWATYRVKNSPTAPDLFTTAAKDSSHLNESSSHLGADSSHLGGDSSHLDRLRESGLPEAVREVAGRGKVKPELMEKAILELCRGRYLTVLELATLLNRYPPSLRNRHITPMVAAGLLRLRFPRQGNRPDQAYTAAESLPPSSEPPPHS